VWITVVSMTSTVEADEVDDFAIAVAGPTVDYVRTDRGHGPWGLAPIPRRLPLPRLVIGMVEHAVRRWLRVPDAAAEDPRRTLLVRHRVRRPVTLEVADPAA